MNGLQRGVLIIGLLVMGVTVIYPPWIKSYVREKNMFGLPELPGQAGAGERLVTLQLSAFRHSLGEPHPVGGWKVDYGRLIPYLLAEVLATAAVFLLIGARTEQQGGT